MNHEQLVASLEAKREIKQALKTARAVCKRKRTDHRRYLDLKREKKKLTRQMREEFRVVLADFRSLCATMREAEQTLRGALGDREKQSATFQRGYKLGIEHAQVKQHQAELDHPNSSAMEYQN